MSLHNELISTSNYVPCLIHTYILVSPTEHKDFLNTSQNHSSVTMFLNFIE